MATRSGGLASRRGLRVVGGMVAGLAALALVAGCAAETRAPSDASAVPRSPSAAPAVGPLTEVATGLDAPWSLAFVADSALASERDSGRILEIAADGTVREAAVLDDVAHGGEGGLLGLAIDDALRLYVYSSGDDGNRVQRFSIEGEPGALTLSAPETIIDDLPSAGNHNAGRIAFGPDGMLYVPVGDAGQPASAQDPDALGGKILRLTPDGGIPVDNPTPSSPVYSLGHRNVQGIDWTEDGRMFASEFGQNTWDELNEITPGGNYGWPEVEGIAGVDEFVDPVQIWAPSDASPSGLTIIDDTIYLANLRGEVLRSIPVSDPSTSSEHFSGEYGRLRDAVEGPDGRLWILTNNTDGRGDARDGDDRIISVELSELSN